VKPFHKHKWVVYDSSLSDNVHVCKCGKFQTLLYDRSKEEPIWIDGCFVSVNKKIVIFAGNRSEFATIEKSIVDTTSIPRSDVILATKDNLRGFRGASVYFYGNWWDNPEYQSEEMTFMLNRLLREP